MQAWFTGATSVISIMYVADPNHAFYLLVKMLMSINTHTCVRADASVGIAYDYWSTCNTCSSIADALRVTTGHTTI